MLRVTKYKERGPSLIRGWNDAGTKIITIDREDGWGVEFKTALPHPYTIFQTIVRKIEWDPDKPGERSPDRQRFTEAWHSHARTDILDKFVVARYYRVGAVGRLVLHARAWVVPGHVDFAANGFTKGTIGNEPWADTHGKMGTIPIHPGTLVLERRFLAGWDNFHADGSGIEDSKKTDSHYQKGKDMTKMSSDRTYAVPPPGGFGPPSPELHM